MIHHLCLFISCIQKNIFFRRKNKFRRKKADSNGPCWFQKPLFFHKKNRKRMIHHLCLLIGYIQKALFFLTKNRFRRRSAFPFWQNNTLRKGGREREKDRKTPFSLTTIPRTFDKQHGTAQKIQRGFATSRVVLCLFPTLTYTSCHMKDYITSNRLSGSWKIRLKIMTQNFDGP